MTSDFAAARRIMVDSQIRTADVTDLALQDALYSTPRETLLPADKAFAAYADTEVALAPGRWLMRPRDIGKLLQALRPRAGERALAIAAPYAAEVLKTMGLEVEQSENGALTQDGVYDLIVCEASVAKAPAAWTGALKTGGRLGVVERKGPMGSAFLYVRTTEGIGGRPLFDSAAPFLTGFEPQQSFAL
jgi:protein-L-isoaspartate(D-aspartate) O-methyltransferase